MKRMAAEAPAMNGAADSEVNAYDGVNGARNSVSLRCASANVLTLLPHQEERSYAKISDALMLSKVQMLEQEFHTHGLDIIGVQEGRGKRECMREGLHYRMLVAAADETGNYGVQCWLSRCAHVQVIQWRVVYTRLMYAVITTANAATVVIVVAHAPQSYSPEGKIEEFWIAFSQTVQELQCKYPSADWIGLIDANGRVGSTQAPCIGAAMPERENSNGSRLRCAMTSGLFYLVNTFDHGSGPTWCSSMHTWSRIDYVFARMSQWSRVYDCRVLLEV